MRFVDTPQGWLSRVAAGLGGSRRCDLGGKNYVNEEVIAWEPERHRALRINDSSLPFAGPTSISSWLPSASSGPR